MSTRAAFQIVITEEPHRKGTKYHATCNECGPLGSRHVEEEIDEMSTKHIALYH